MKHTISHKFFGQGLLHYSLSITRLLEENSPTIYNKAHNFLNQQLLNFAYNASVCSPRSEKNLAFIYLTHLGILTIRERRIRNPAPRVPP